MALSRIIFLDIDGVLNSNFWNDTHQRELSNGTLIHREKVALLGELVRKTGAEIVLHSGWKFWFDHTGNPIRRESLRLVDMLQAQGLKIYDVTPDYTTEEIRRTKRFSLVKAREILGWLDEHTETESWIVIDDLDLHNDIVSQHQIKTDQTVGLTEHDIEKAEEMLLT